MPEDYYYDYDPNLNLVYNDDVFYGQFPDERDLYNAVVNKDNHKLPTTRKHKKQKQKQSQLSSFVNMILLCIILLVIVLFTAWRYGLVGYAIGKGHTLPALALLSPEIGNAVYLAAL